MKVFLITLFVTISVFPLYAQNISVNSGWDWNKKTIKASRNVIQHDVSIRKEFTKIKAKKSINVFYKQGDNFSIQLEADDNIIDFITLNFKGDQLLVSVKDKTSFKNAKAFQVNIVTPNLTDISVETRASFEALTNIDVDEITLGVSTSGGIELQDLYTNSTHLTARTSGDLEASEIIAENVTVDVDTSGSIETSLKADSLIANVQTSGDFIVSGEVENAKLSVATSGDIEALELMANHVIGTASTSGDIEIYAISTLDATASTSGGISYYGNPKVTKSQSTSGEVSKID